jgi:hypothetical protein
MLNYNLNVIGSQRDRTLRQPPPLPFGEFFIQLQVVGGGGAGGGDIGGAGGAGGVHYVPAYIINDENTYSVVIGEGHDGFLQDPWTSDPPLSNESGSNSYFRNNTTLFDIIGYGGGCAGRGGINPSGNNGGSGGGGSQFGGGGGSPEGAFNTGSSGGDAGPSNYQGGGGGGGATQNGFGGNSETVGSDASKGGNGIAILGFESGSKFVAGGGGGARNIGAFAAGGAGGGGNSGYWDGNVSSSLAPQRGTPNTGGGGGGIYNIPPTSLSSSFDTGGGSGLVVIYYKGIQQALGGQVETRELNDSIYTQHIFTASGEFIPISHT